MEHDKMDDNRWVDDRMASLDPGDWKPDSSAAFSGLMQRNAKATPPARNRWWVWATVSATAAAAGIAMLLLSAPPACANPLGCKQISQPAPAPVADPAPTSAPAPVAVAPASAQKHKRSFKESGSLTAPISCEVYTDYQCPHCARFYTETVPQLMSQYVKTGKVRYIHRDFPLPQHPYARLAAQYANAAGELGYYDAVVAELFRTQGVWSGDGDPGLQVESVLPPAVMEKVRSLVKNDPAPEASIDADMEMVRADQVTQTPTLVFVWNGRRQVMPGSISFPLLKSFLDDLLERK
jgi:protein-disulfide isomerase